MVGRSSSPALMACLPVSLPTLKGSGTTACDCRTLGETAYYVASLRLHTVAAEQLLPSTRSRVHASYPLDDRRMIAV